MLTLPAAVLPLIIEFAPLFSKPVWEHAKILLVGAILATGADRNSKRLSSAAALWRQLSCRVPRASIRDAAPRRRGK